MNKPIELYKTNNIEILKDKGLYGNLKEKLDVASNPSTPGYVLNIMSLNAKNLELKKAIARHSNSHASVLKRLATTDKFYISVTAMRNRNATIEVIQAGYNSGCEYARSQAYKIIKNVKG